MVHVIELGMSRVNVKLFKSISSKFAPVILASSICGRIVVLRK